MNPLHTLRSASTRIARGLFGLSLIAGLGASSVASATSFAVLFPEAGSTAALDGATGDITLGGLRITGLEPDEIDVSTKALLELDGLPMRGLDAGELAFDRDGQVLIPLTHNEIVLPGVAIRGSQQDATGRWVDAKGVGTAILVPTSAALREAPISPRSTETQVVLDVAFQLKGVYADSPAPFRIQRLSLGSAGATFPGVSHMGTAMADSLTTGTPGTEGAMCSGVWCHCWGADDCNGGIAACFALPHVDPDNSFICDEYDSEGQCVAGSCYML